MTSVLEVVLGNEVKIATAFTDADGAAIATSSARFFAHVRDHRIGAETGPTSVGTGQYETLWRPDQRGRWKWRIEGLDGTNAVVAADEGEIEILSDW